MSNKVFYSTQAVTDLEEIKEYIVLELNNPIAAENVVDRIFKSIDLLEDFPAMGTKLSSVIGLDSGYRFLVAGNYMIFYRIEREMVFVDRILYKHRDYMRTLFNESENE